MRKLLVAFFLLFTVCVYAQDTANIIHDSSTDVKIEAKFPGGPQAWFKFLSKNIHQEVAEKNGAPRGNYTVVVSFLIDTAGKLSEVTILNDPGYGTANDVLKALKHSPDWLPATINGKPVIYRQKQNITYQVYDQ